MLSKLCQQSVLGEREATRVVGKESGTVCDRKRELGVRDVAKAKRILYTDREIRGCFCHGRPSNLGVPRSRESEAA